MTEQPEPDLPATVQRVVTFASNAGLDVDVVEYPQGTRTAVEAAAAVGCEVGQIVKSLIFDLDGEIVLALTSGSNRVDTDQLATLAGTSGCGRADADRVREVTGFAIGGVPPFAHANPLRAFFDRALGDHDVVWAAAGTPRHVFALDPAVLLEISGATPGDFGIGG